MRPITIFYGKPFFRLKKKLIAQCNERPYTNNDITVTNKHGHSYYANVNMMVKGCLYCVGSQLIMNKVIINVSVDASLGSVTLAQCTTAVGAHLLYNSLLKKKKKNFIFLYSFSIAAGSGTPFHVAGPDIPPKALSLISFLNIYYGHIQFWLSLCEFSVLNVAI